MSKKRATIIDVAKTAGVAASTVSYVLNKRNTAVKISEKTTERVLKAVAEYNYQPNAAARALSSRRTGQIGFILSDAVSAGWGDPYYGQMLQGVEAACHRRGYNLLVSRCNLSNLDTFVFPRHVGQRSIDGVVLTGYLQANVITKFREFGIPCFCIGDDVEISRIIPTFAVDAPAAVTEKMSYACTLGHRKFLIGIHITPRQRQICTEAINRLQQNSKLEDCSLRLININDYSDPNDAETILQKWLSIDEDQRPTCIMSTDRIIARLMGLLASRGVQCPRDISLMAFSDSLLCESCTPRITSTYLDIQSLSQMVTDTLIDYLKQDKEPDPKISRNDFPCHLVIRESCGPARKY